MKRMDEITTIIIQNYKLEVLEKALKKYRTMFGDMIVDPRVNNSLKGYYQDQINKIEQEIIEVNEIEKEVKEKGLAGSKFGIKLINKAHNNPG